MPFTYCGTGVAAELLETDVPYVGLMGPRERFEEMLADLREEGVTLSEADRERLYTPVGLDLGGGSPYQIALSVVAEVLAVVGSDFERRRVEVGEPQQGDAMFCNQCEQVKDSGCTKVGTCGKDEDVQSLQEILLYGLKGMAAYAHHARRLGRSDDEVSAFIEKSLFTTLTNVNFDVPTLLELALELGGLLGGASDEVLDALREAGAKRHMSSASARLRQPRFGKAPAVDRVFS